MQERKIRVRLKTDLTRYAQGLIEGTEGYTIGQNGPWSRGSDRFVTVYFPGITTLEVLWTSLEIIDEAVLEEQNAQQRIFEESLKTAHDVVLRLGPRGGFRSLSYSYTDANTGISVHASNGFRDEAYQIMEILKGYGIPIHEERKS